jgi:glycoprotein endo-alpha-1,2-mannosidase
MKKLVVLLALLSLIASSMVATANSRKPLTLVHYLPIFNTPEVSGFMGPHWTMENCKEDKKREDGRRKLCTSQYPTIGAYDSSDPAVQEYHVLLMKLSGIDGLIFDWHSIVDYWPVIPRFRNAVETMIPMLEKAGMKFSVMYEDRTIPLGIQYTYIKGDAVINGKQAVQYAQKHYFARESYVKIGKRPLLFNWGPVYFKEKAQWDKMFEGLPQRPVLSQLDLGNSANEAGFAWTPDMSRGESMDQFYSRFLQEVKNRNWSTVISSAYPGFKDYYKEGGWGNPIGQIPYNNGDTLRKSLDWNRKINPDIVQLVTWNDFGEGTALEPTLEFGSSFLKQIQGFTSPRYKPEDLDLPLKLYNLRKQYAGNEEANSGLDQVFETIVEGDTSTASNMMTVIAAN